MAVVPDPTYITVDEVIAQTSIAGLEDLDNDNTTLLIQHAEDQIDAYCGQQKHNPDDDNINRVFPREQDFDDNGSPEVPYRVSRACLAQVEWLYVQWWATRETSQSPVEHEVSSLRIGGDGSYGEERAGGGKDFAAATLCTQAKAYLDGYRARFIGMGTVDPDLVPPAT